MNMSFEIGWKIVATILWGVVTALHNEFVMGMLFLAYLMELWLK